MLADSRLTWYRHHHGAGAIRRLLGSLPWLQPLPKSFISMENRYQQWFRWIKDPLPSADCSDKLKHWCECLRWEEKFCSCAGGLLYGGETSSCNPAAGKVLGTKLSAAPSGKSSVSNVVWVLVKLRLKYCWVGKSSLSLEIQEWFCSRTWWNFLYKKR